MTKNSQPIATYSAPVPFLKKNGKYIYVDFITMEPVINTEYVSVDLFKDGIAEVTSNFGNLFINKNGKEFDPNKHYNHVFFYGGFFKVRFKDKWGILNTEFNEVVAVKYDNMNDFFNNRASVKLDNEFFTISNIMNCGKAFIYKTNSNHYIGFTTEKSYENLMGIIYTKEQYDCDTCFIIDRNFLLKEVK